MADKRDYYEVLGLNTDANDDQIKKAYRKLAKQYHPDINKDPGAEDKFKEINEAYEVLSDKEKRAKYDQYGFKGVDGSFQDPFADMGDISDIFSSFMGGNFSNFGFSDYSSRSRQSGPSKGDNRYMSLSIEFLEAVHGCKKTINLNVDRTCPHCNGTKAESPSDIDTCPTCHGTGKVTMQTRTPFGVMQQVSACPDCNGTGKRIKRKCHNCNGKGTISKKEEVEIKIPEGINTGQQIRVPGYGEAGTLGGPNGDLYIEIRVKDHEYFERDGMNIYIKVPISSVQATLGCDIDVPTPYGEVSLNIPAGTQPNQTFRIKSHGVKNMRNSSKGDEYVEIEVKIPTKLTREERELYNKLNKENKTSVFEKFKKNFK